MIAAAPDTPTARSFAELLAPLTQGARSYELTAGQYVATVDYLDWKTGAPSALQSAVESARRLGPACPPSAAAQAEIATGGIPCQVVGCGDAWAIIPATAGAQTSYSLRQWERTHDCARGRCTVVITPTRTRPSRGTGDGAGFRAPGASVPRGPRANQRWWARPVNLRRRPDPRHPRVWSRVTCGRVVVYSGPGIAPTGPFPQCARPAEPVPFAETAACAAIAATAGVGAVNACIDAAAGYRSHPRLTPPPPPPFKFCNQGNLYINCGKKNLVVPWVGGPPDDKNYAWWVKANCGPAEPMRVAMDWSGTKTRAQLRDGNTRISCGEVTEVVPGPMTVNDIIKWTIAHCYGQKPQTYAQWAARNPAAAARVAARRRPGRSTPLPPAVYQFPNAAPTTVRGNSAPSASRKWVTHIICGPHEEYFDHALFPADIAAWTRAHCYDTT